MVFYSEFLQWKLSSRYRVVEGKKIKNQIAITGQEKSKFNMVKLSTKLLKFKLLGWSGGIRKES